MSSANDDIEKAIKILREKYASIQLKKGEREMAKGRIAIFIDPAKKIGAILEMRCESAPVVKSDWFVLLANEIAKQVALKEPASVEALLAQPLVDDPKKTVNERIGDVVGLIRENMKPARMARLTGLLGSYCHHDGSVGVLLQVEGAQAEPQLLRDTCMHITAKNPIAGRREDVPQEVIDREMEIARAQAAATGNPPEIVEKIVEGKMKTWFADNVLLEQPFVKDDSKTVGDLLKAANLTFSRFIRYKVGEIS